MPNSGFPGTPQGFGGYSQYGAPNAMSPQQGESAFVSLCVIID